MNDYHTSLRRQLSPVVEDAEGEAMEGEAKRQRAIEPSEQANFTSEGCDAYLAATSTGYLNHKALDHYHKHEAAFLASGVNVSEFMFGVRRNSFQDKYKALASTEGGNSNGTKKKGRKELKLSEISAEHRQLFVGQGGADEKEWSAWKMKEACEILSAAESRRVRKEKPELIVPTRWVRTTKNDGLVDKGFLAKSRLVVQGFKDKSLGYYRRDAPTASAVAESICLAVCAYYKFILIAKDIKQERGARDLLGASQGRPAWAGAREARRKQLKEELSEEEQNTFQSSAGELGWLARQLRCDLAYENGVAQRRLIGLRNKKTRRAYGAGCRSHSGLVSSIPQCILAFQLLAHLILILLCVVRNGGYQNSMSPLSDRLASCRVVSVATVVPLSSFTTCLYRLAWAVVFRSW